MNGRSYVECGQWDSGFDCMYVSMHITKKVAEVLVTSTTYAEDCSKIGSAVRMRIHSRIRHRGSAYAECIQLVLSLNKADQHFNALN